jgi:putative inorganic carbon (hco3(-)) transporter
MSVLSSPALPTLGRDGRVRIAAALAAGGLGWLAVDSPRRAVEALAAGALIVLAFSRLTWAVAVFVLVTFPENLPGALGGVATVAKPVGAVLAVAWLGYAAARSGRVVLLPRQDPALFWTAAVLLLLAAASLLWAADASQTMYQLQRLAQVAVFLAVAYTAASTRRSFHLIIAAFLLASVVTSIYSMASGSYIAGDRLGGLFDPNYYAAELIPAVVIAFFLLLTARRALLRVALLAVIGVDLAAFALTQSRGGIIGIAVSCAVAVAFAGRARPRVVVGVLLFCALSAAYVLVFSPSHLSDSSGSSGRSDEWRIALRMIRDHPVQGVGLGNYQIVEPAYAKETINLHHVKFVVQDRLVAHNSYLELGAELGIVGALLFVSILLIALRRAVVATWRFERAHDELEWFARGLVAGAAGMFTAYFFLSAQYEKQLWLVIALLATLATVAHRASTLRNA